MAKNIKNQDPEEVTSGSENTESTDVASTPEMQEYKLLQEENNLLKLSIEEEQKAKEEVEKSLKEAQEQIEKLEAKILSLESQSQDKKELTSEATDTETSTKKEKLIWKDKSGTEFTFTEAAPERFNFDGKNKSLKEWIQDDLAMESLVRGKSIYVQQKKI